MILTRSEGNIRFNRRLWTIVLSIGAAIAVPAMALAQEAAPRPVATAAGGSLNLNPKRVTFDRPGKSATISVSSAGGGSAYDVELIDRVMLPDGQIVPVSEAPNSPEAARLKSAKPYMVVTPRRIRVGSGGSQAIRLRASAAPDLAPGEYRSHLTVTGIPPADAGLTADQAAGDKEGQLSFRINSVLALSIPVILRVGPIDVRAGIEKSAISVEDAPGGRTAFLMLDLVRQGTNSLFGDLEVRGSKKQGGEPIGAVRGIGVYPEIDRRQVKIQLSRIPAPGEQIDIQFTDDDTKPGTVLSKASLMAP